MIFRRTVANLRAQNWLAIAIELGIVIVGVFIGTQVANWNADRLEKLETQRMLSQLKPNLRLLSDYYDNAREYYGTTRKYSRVALAGWRGDPQVSDSDFVIAAYQSSQIIGVGTNGSAWATVLGADQLRRIDDPAIRTNLSSLMSSDYSIIDLASVDTPYRQNVRRLIPIDIQDAIRARCGDRPHPTRASLTFLPPACNYRIVPSQAAQTAATLRAQPALLADLHWHMAAKEAMLANMAIFETPTENLQRLIAKSGG